MMRKKFAYLTVGFLFFAVTPALSLEIEDKAPDFTIKSLESKEVSLSSFKDKQAVMLVFWATWCPNCKREIPEIKKIGEEFGDKIRVLAINVDVNDSLSKTIAYKAKHAINYTILYDKGTRFSRQYGVMGTPTIFIIDKKGIVRYKGATVPKEEDIKNHMSTLLGE